VYVFADFIAACSKGEVFVESQAEQDAYNLFSLTKPQLLAFIANDGLEELEYINTKVWENNPRPANVVYIDGYNFTTGFKRGYLAFKQNYGKWIIKSFHLSDDRNTVMMDAVLRSGYKGAIGVKR
jgi:hypothetical protein